MNGYVAVALGGAIGASGRYFVYQMAAHTLGTHYPYATLIVNVAGSFVMGLLIEIMALAWSPGTETRLFLTVGLLGAFTTFSTFSLDFAVLYRRGDLFAGGLYVALSVLLSIGGLFAGLALARRIMT